MLKNKNIKEILFMALTEKECKIWMDKLELAFKQDAEERAKEFLTCFFYIFLLKAQ